MSSTSWVLSGSDGSMRIPIRSRLTVTPADTAIGAGVAGLGVTRVLSYQVADALRDGHLVRLLAEHEPPSVPVSLVYGGQGRLPMKCRAVLDFAAPKLRQRMAELPAPGSRKLAAFHVP